jgi:two-component system chemotaxis response regulator CheY
MTQKILIVDDSKVSRVIIQRCLEMIVSAESTYVEAANGKEALAEMNEQDFDLVIADINMPEMDGKLLLKWIRSSEKLKGIPVVFVTSTDNPAQVEELKALGANAVLAKPVTAASLEHVIQDIFA